MLELKVKFAVFLQKHAAKSPHLGLTLLQLSAISVSITFWSRYFYFQMGNNLFQQLLMELQEAKYHFLRSKPFPLQLFRACFEGS